MIKILIINIGIKISIIKYLIKNFSIYFLNKKINKNNLFYFDALFISNGPGNPNNYFKYKNIILFFLYFKIPILSICLGHQIISILNNFEIFKLKFGHHSSNHPIFNYYNKKLFINTQNHNFNIKNKIKKNYLNNFFSLLDYNFQNIKSYIQPIFSFQNHPEGNSGTNDFIFYFNYYTI